MKIAFDITPISNQHKTRGIGYYTNNLIKALKRFDKQNSYVLFNRGERLAGDINLIHYPYFDPFFLTLPIRKIRPTVVTIHDLIPLRFPDKFPSGIRGRIKWWLQRVSLRTVREVITVSQSSRDDIVDFTGFSKSKIHVIYSAPAEEFKKITEDTQLVSIRKKYNLPEKFVLYVGDVTWNKNLPRLIKAIKMINVPLVMVGKALMAEKFDKNNPWSQDLAIVQEAAEKDKRIIRLGFIPQEDLVRIYNLATVFVMPSIYEGFGLPVLEAMACGTPVVCSQTSSFPELVGKAAIMINPDNVESIAEGISRVYFLNEDECLKLTEENFLQVKNFSWEKTAFETVDVYKKALNI